MNEPLKGHFIYIEKVQNEYSNVCSALSFFVLV